jgi:hypothetical protein
LKIKRKRASRFAGRPCPFRLNYNNQKSKFVKKKFYFWIFSLDGISTDEIATYEIATASAPQKPRNDKGEEKYKIATPAFGGLASIGTGF